MLECHQCEQGEDHRLVGEQPIEYLGQPDRLGSGRGAHRVITGGWGIPRGEDQVDDRCHHIQPFGEPVGCGEGEWNACGRDLLLGPGEPGCHGRLLDQEQPGNFCNVEPVDEPQCKGGPGIC